ncbi:hypothetical protein CDV36_012748 [Fusarium kuroshium]|uniref:Uncharacterized protein n=1 Tax=Fusarium kuroshium TaxID=2010991 RepID=A0A3M2RQT1_9HYPO|nr:hypothetical protein CDV36_012748 [Fusarium kuroshium]
MTVLKPPEPVLPHPFQSHCQPPDLEAARGPQSLPPTPVEGRTVSQYTGYLKLLLALYKPPFFITINNNTLFTPSSSQIIDAGINRSSEDRDNHSSSEEKSSAKSHSRQNKDQEHCDSKDKHKLPPNPERLKKHRDQTEKLQEILEPALGSGTDESCVLLLCCGSPSACCVLPVPIPISTVGTDYVGQWSLIKESWNTFHKNWRHRLPFYGVKQVSFASVSLSAQVGSNRFGDGHSHFLGACTPEDLKGQMQQQQAIIDQVTKRESACSYYPYRGTFEHTQECDDHREAHYTVFEPFESPYECPFEDIRETKRMLLQLSRRRSLLTLAFQRPEASDANDLIPRSLFYSHLETLRLCDEWECPSLYELPFEGLMVEEGWLLPSHSIFLVYIGGIFSLVVPLRFMFGGWDAAWGAASCLLTLAMFGYQYTRHKATCA